jgi:hypothetical protein
MRIEDLKRWHWVVIGIVAGLALGYLYASVEPQVPRSIGQQTFERDLTRKLDSGHAILSNLVVYPPKDGVAVVTGMQLERVRGGGDQWAPKPFSFWVRMPYKPQENAPGDASATTTVQEYLAHVASQHDHVTFRYAWWRETTAIYTICVLGAVAVIGGIWPIVINLLVGAGFGRRSEPDPEYDLSRFGQGQEESKAGKKEMTEADYDQLKALEAELERNLQPSGSGAAGQVGPGEGPPAAVRALSGVPLEASSLAQQQEDKDYAGEFYPTVAHAPKPKKKAESSAHEE